MGAYAQATRDTAGRCRFGKIIDINLDAEDRAAIEEDLSTGRSGTWITATIIEITGCRVARSTVEEHRAGRCICHG